jgi:hypothetical protein
MGPGWPRKNFRTAGTICKAAAIAMVDRMMAGCTAALSCRHVASPGAKVKAAAIPNQMASRTASAPPCVPFARRSVSHVLTPNSGIRH